jgi:hypothetical protein
MGLRVWVVEEQTHAHVPVGFPFEPINKPMCREIDSNPYPNREKTTEFRVAGTHCHLTNNVGEVLVTVLDTELLPGFYHFLTNVSDGNQFKYLIISRCPYMLREPMI